MAQSVPKKPSTDHYFSALPDIDSERSTIEVFLSDISMQLTTDKGVFSKDGLDAGTRVLLQEACQPQPNQMVLDIGCGYGPIACAAALRAPSAQIWAIDVNQRAIDLCNHNAKQLGLQNVAATTAVDIPACLTFDLIVSNPPIRVGKKVLHELLVTWLTRLNPQGHAELVVHKHLGSDSLAKWLNAQGFETHRRLSRLGYRILDVKAKANTSTDSQTEQ